MRKIFFVLLFTCISGASIIVNAQDAKSMVGEIVGEWKYKVAQAPYGYDTGVISIKEDKKDLIGEVIFDSGYKVKLQSVDFKNDTLRVGVYIDSEYINILSLVKGNTLEGTIDSSQGKMNLIAERSE